MRYKDAINHTIRKYLATGDLYVFGQDIRMWGGQGGILNGLYTSFPDKVYDTPISESAIAGMATGLAMAGKKVLVEYAFLDFILHATDNIINNSSKISHISNGNFNVPVVYYATINSDRGYGPTHSQSLEYIFTKVPGLTVVYPSNVKDASLMLEESFNRNTPTLFLTHKHLLELEDASFVESLKFHKQEVKNGKSITSKILQKGNKLTIISYGRMLKAVEEALLDLKSNDQVELIDLRYLSPIDFDVIMTSVNKTKNLLIVEEGYGSISNEVISKLATNTEYKDVKFTKLNSEFEIIGVASELEKSVLVNKTKITETIVNLLDLT